MNPVTRIDETWQRLLRWTMGQAPSERLAAQILAHEGYEDIDPSHPLGGKDGGRDATCTKDGAAYIMAVYFPRDQQEFKEIEAKFSDDLAKAAAYDPAGFAFVTNQELRLAERKKLCELGEAKSITVELFHLERIAGILDRPPMSQIRKQYLDIDPGPMPIEVELEILGSALHFSDSTEMLEWWLDDAAGKERKRLQGQATTQLPLSVNFAPWVKHPKAPSTQEELDEHLVRWENQVRAGWTDSLDHLAAAGRAGLKFRLRNTGNVFLNDVQIILTIPDVRGVWWKDRDLFDEDKLFPPVLPAPIDPLDPANLYHQDYLDDYRMADYPVSWRNIGKAVEITLDLKHLRPHPVWESDDDDIILLVDGEHPPTELSATWTVTAQGYGAAYKGAPVTIPVESKSVIDVWESLVAAASS